MTVRSNPAPRLACRATGAHFRRQQHVQGIPTGRCGGHGGHGGRGAGRRGRGAALLDFGWRSQIRGRAEEDHAGQRPCLERLCRGRRRGRQRRHRVEEPSRVGQPTGRSPDQGPSHPGMGCRRCAGQSGRHRQGREVGQPAAQGRGRCHEVQGQLRGCPGQCAPRQLDVGQRRRIEKSRCGGYAQDLGRVFCSRRQGQGRRPDPGRPWRPKLAGFHHL